MVNEEQSTADSAAKVEILVDGGEYVDLTLDGVKPFFRLLKTYSMEEVSFTLDEHCVIHYATEDDERFIIAQKDDLVLVVETDWTDKIKGIKVLQVDPDNYDPKMLN